MGDYRKLCQKCYEEYLGKIKEKKKWKDANS